MDKALINYVKSLLRRAWGRSRQRQDALKRAKVSYGHYECEHCNKVFRRKNIEVDHIVAVGVFNNFELFIERLFCPAKGLQILCRGCHLVKTGIDKKSFKK